MPNEDSVVQWTGEVNTIERNFDYRIIESYEYMRTYMSGIDNKMETSKNRTENLLAKIKKIESETQTLVYIADDEGPIKNSIDISVRVQKKSGCNPIRLLE